MTFEEATPRVRRTMYAIRRQYIQRMVEDFIHNYYVRGETRPIVAGSKYRTASQLQKALLKELEPAMLDMAAILARPDPNLDTYDL